MSYFRRRPLSKILTAHAHRSRWFKLRLVLAHPLHILNHDVLSQLSRLAYFVEPRG